MVCFKGGTAVLDPQMSSSPGGVILLGGVSDEAFSISPLLSDRLTNNGALCDPVDEQQIPDTVLFEAPSDGFLDDAAAAAAATTNQTKIHGASAGHGASKKFVYHCLEPACGFSSTHRERFIIHLRCLHHLEIDERMLEFTDWSSFQRWKEQHEANTGTKFVKPHPRVQFYQTQNLESQAFCCSWLGHSKQSDSSRWKPCIGHMVARRSVHSGKVTVYCILSHYGHPIGQQPDKSTINVERRHQQTTVVHHHHHQKTKKSQVTLLVNQDNSATTNCIVRSMPTNNDLADPTSRIIKVVRPISLPKKSFPQQRDSDVEVDSDFSLESSEDEIERPCFKTVLRVIRREGKIVHEKIRVPIAENETLSTKASSGTHYQCLDCADQQFSSSQRHAFIQHLIEKHTSRPEDNIYVFNNIVKFVAFKTRMESKFRCAFVLRRKCGSDLMFECSRSGRYRTEKASAVTKTRCTARMIVSTSRDGLIEARVCATHYGHEENGNRLNVAKRHALKIAEMAASRSSRDIYQLLISTGAKQVNRDAVKSIIGYMRRNEGRFDYQAWQREVSDDKRDDESLKDNLRRSVQKLVQNDPKLQQRLLERLPDLIPNSIRSGCDNGASESNQFLVESSIPSVNDPPPRVVNRTLNLLEGDDSDWEGSETSSTTSEEHPNIHFDNHSDSSLNGKSQLSRNIKGNIIVINGSPEDSVQNVCAKEVLRQARQIPEAELDDANIQEDLVEERLAEVEDVERPCEDLIGDKMGNVLIENEDVATNLLREILDVGSAQSRAQDGDHDSNHNNSNNSTGTNNNNNGEASNGRTEGETQQDTSEKSENDSSTAQAQGQTTPSSKEKTVGVGKIIEARLKDTLQLSDQEQALKRSIEEAIFTNPVRYELPKVPNNNNNNNNNSTPNPPTLTLLSQQQPQQRKVSSSEEESSEGEQPEIEKPPPKVTTKFAKALASVRNLHKDKAEKRKFPDEPLVPTKVKVLVVQRNEEQTEAQRAHEYRDRLMAGPSVPRHDPKAPSPSGSTPHGKKKLAVQATDRGNKKS